jgi:peptidoglycan/LPS O-acetylase OafA/YrhL
MNKDYAAEGLRGLAAVNVFFAHFFLAFFPLGFVHFFPWVAQPGAQGGITEKLLSLPFLSALWNGRFPVCIFFVLSGYVLTRGFLRTGDASILRSLAFRRYFRLGIPIFASVMLAFTLARFGLYSIDPTVALTKSQWLARLSISDLSLMHALKDGIWGVIFLGHDQFNTVFWTMRTEFIGSMAIFAYRLLAFPGRRGALTAVVYVALAVALVPNDWPYYVAFLLGSHIDQWRRPMPKWMLYGAIAVAVYLASIDGSPMFRLFNALPLDDVARTALWSVLAGFIVVYAVRAGAFGAFLTSRPALFLGRISYPLYLIHAPIILSLGCGVFVVLIEHAGLPRSLAAAGALLACLPASIGLAVLFERWIDQPAIRLGKRLVASMDKSAETEAIAATP